MSDLSACNAQAGMSIGMIAGDIGKGRINEGVVDGAVFNASGIIIGEPPCFPNCSKLLNSCQGTAFPAASVSLLKHIVYNPTIY